MQTLWFSLPNDPITDFRGRVVRTPQLDDNMEVVFQRIRCPGEGCDHHFTNLRAWQDHVAGHDVDLSGLRTAAPRECLVDLRVAQLLLQVLSALRAAPANSPLRKIQKPNDSFHATETWRRAWLARDAEAVSLHATHYEWLHALLARPLPLSSADKTDGVAVSTVAQHLFGLSWYGHVQALTIVSARAVGLCEDPPLVAVGPTPLAHTDKSA